MTILKSMVEIDGQEAETALSALLRRVAAGEEILIIGGGQPLARLVPVSQGHDRVFGQDHGRFEVPDDFDAPLPDEVLATFGA